MEQIANEKLKRTNRHEEFFKQAEQLLLRAAILILLVIELARIIIPAAMALPRHVYNHTETIIENTTSR